MIQREHITWYHSLSCDKIKSCDTNEKLSRDLIFIWGNAHVEMIWKNSNFSISIKVLRTPWPGDRSVRIRIISKYSWPWSGQVRGWSKFVQVGPSWSEVLDRPWLPYHSKLILFDSFESQYWISSLIMTHIFFNRWKVLINQVVKQKSFLNIWESLENQPA